MALAPAEYLIIGIILLIAVAGIVIVSRRRRP